MGLGEGGEGSEEGRSGVVKGRGCLEDYVGREGLWIKGGELEKRDGKGEGSIM